MFDAFKDEMAKIGRKKKGLTFGGKFKAMVHHPLTQALGYGALAGEGIHMLAHMAPQGNILHRMAASRPGGIFNIGSVGTGAAFLGLEGLAALGDLLKRKKVRSLKGRRRLK
jgi:hypothetical protein